MLGVSTFTQNVTCFVFSETTRSAYHVFVSRCSEHPGARHGHASASPESTGESHVVTASATHPWAAVTVGVWSRRPPSPNLPEQPVLGSREGSVEVSDTAAPGPSGPRGLEPQET